MGTVATLLDEHLSFRCTSVDRIAIRGYIAGLQYEGGVVKFLLNRGGTIPSPAPAPSPVGPVARPAPPPRARWFCPARGALPCFLL
jgi:hypothetical protein